MENVHVSTSVPGSVPVTVNVGSVVLPSVTSSTTRITPNVRTSMAPSKTAGMPTSSKQLLGTTSMIPSGDLTSVLIQCLAMQQSQKNSQVQASGSTLLPTTSATNKKKINFNVKVINSPKIKDCPVYVLRNVDETTLTTHRKLIEEIQKQFGSAMIPDTHHLPVGYFKGSTKITIRTDADVADIWMRVKKGEQITLWCQGNHPSDVSSDSDDELIPPRKKRKGTKKKLSALEEKANRVEQSTYAAGKTWNLI